MSAAWPPSPLCEDHDLAHFDCGVASLNDWLLEYALWNQTNGYTRTFVICPPGTNHVVGYYALASGMIVRDELHRRHRSHPAPREIPVALLARFAVDKNHQGQGVAAALLRNALLNAASASQTVAFRAVVVDALSEQIASFYKKYGFQETRKNNLKLILPMQDIIASMRKSPGPDS
ncbi:MAG: GNAT family N-acetyltransferase [Proteobacteria bacterium]|nr:GNAT family N-acetyltransferase [Pseudomonadota bacterium]